MSSGAYYFTLGRSPVEAGCIHSSVNKPGANGRVSYDSLTHCRLYCSDCLAKLHSVTVDSDTPHTAYNNLVLSDLQESLANAKVNA